MFACSIVTGQAHDAISGGVEEPHDGVRDAIEPVERRGREERIAFGVQDGHGFRHQFAKDNVQRCDDDEADSNRDRGNRCIGQPQRSKRLVDHA